MSGSLDRILGLMILAMGSLLSVQAQVSISGVVQGVDGQPIPGVTLRIIPVGGESAVAFGTTTKDGRFRLAYTPAADVSYHLVATRLNFQPSVLPLHEKGHGRDSLPDQMLVRMETAASTLKEIVVRSTGTPFKTRGDTLEYKAAAYRNAETRKLEDLLRRMNGFDLSPDGRIRYNGREIDRILIEGEDMTEKNYRLISRNLGAGLIDKVQVLQDFTVDRLMKDVEKSGRIGINLTIDSSRRGRLTGTAEAGAGIGGREWLDNNTIRVGERLKSLAFIRYNETGEASDPDVGYHFNDGGQRLEAEPTFGIPKPVNAGFIPLPPLEGAYVRDNRDMGGHLLVNARPGRAVRYKALIGTDVSRLQNAARGSETHFIPNVPDWSIEQQTRSTSKSLGLLGRLGMEYDRGGSHTGRWTVEAMSGRKKDGYDDATGGAIADTLIEGLTTFERTLRIHGGHVTKLRSGKVLKGGLSFSFDRLHQDFQTETGRLHGLFPSDSSQTRFMQNLLGFGNKGEANLSLHGRIKKTEWRLGVQSGFEGLLYESCGWVQGIQNGRQSELNPSNSQLKRRMGVAFAFLERPFSAKTRFSASLQGGYAHVSRFLDGRRQDGGFPLYEMNVAVRKRVSPLRMYSMEFSSGRSLPGAEHFHPTALLTGEATVRWPVDIHSTYARHALRFQHLSNRLSKGREYMFTGGVSRSVGSYVQFYERTPSFLIVYARAIPFSDHIDVQYRFSRYLQNLKVKTGVSGGAAIVQGRLVYNTTPGIHRMMQIHVRGHAATAYPGMVNMEASFLASRAADRLLPEHGSPVGSFQWSLQGHFKCRFRWSDKFFMAVMDRFYLLDQPSRFLHAVDLHASLEIPPAWRFSLTGHNLLDVDRISQRVPGPGSLSERSTALVGRYLQLRVAVDF